MRVGVVGIGTRHGDDAAGLRVAEQLARSPLPPEIRVHSCERSPLDLVEALAGVDAAILIDATRSGRRPGSVRRLGAGELRQRGSLSTHGFGVPEALALAEALDAAPARLALIGIEAAATAGDGLSPAVDGAVAAACDLVRALAAEWLGTGRPVRGSPRRR